MALRLPDIPFESWIADQQDRLGRLTESAFPALEFKSAALEQEAMLPSYANEEQLAEEERRRLAEEQKRAQEAEALRQQQQAELERQQRARMEEQAAAQQKQSYVDQAWQMAQNLGIPTPGDALDYFTGAHTRPSVGGDNEASAGTFASAEGTSALSDPSGSGVPYTDPAKIQSSDDFLAATGSLNDSVFGPAQPPPESDTPIYDALTGFGARSVDAARTLTRGSPVGSVAFDIGEGAVRGVGAAADAAANFEFEHLPRVIGATGRGLERTYEEKDRPGVGSELGRGAVSLVTGRERPSAIDEARADVEARARNPVVIEAMRTVQNLGQDLIIGKMSGDVAGEIWKEYGLPMIHVGDMEINPGEFLVPDRLAMGGANAAAQVAMSKGAVKFGAGIAGGIERGAGKTMRGVGGHLADVYGEGASMAADALQRTGEGIEAVARPVGRAIGDVARPLGEAAVSGLKAADRGLGNLLRDEAPDMRGAIPAYRIGSPSEGGRRMFHGTGAGWASPDPEKFDPDGLFGPGYYLTSDPRVAAEYANTRARPAGSQAVQKELHEAVLQANEAERAWEKSGYSPDLEEELNRLYKEVATISERHRLTLDNEVVGQQIRPVDLANRMSFYHADKPVPQTDIRKIVGALRELLAGYPDLVPMVQEYDALARMSPEQYRNLARRPNGPLDGEQFYNNLGKDFISEEETARRFSIDQFGDRDADIKPDKEFVNRVLHEAGFDGVYYGGGQRMGIRDEAGKIIEHDAVVVFPERLDSLRNALSGESRGAMARGEATKAPSWEVFEPRTGDVAKTFDNEADAAAYAQRVTNETGQFHDYGTSNETPYTPVDMFERAAGAERTRASGKFAARARELLPTHTLVGSGTGATIGAPAGAVAGWESAPEDAPFSEKLERAKIGFMSGLLVGGGAGGLAGVMANVAGTKIVQRGLRNGSIDLEVLSTHPSLNSRFKAMMLLAARDKADDEIVDVPSMVSYLLKETRSASDRQVAEQVQNTNMTAGMIREQFATSKFEDIGRAAKALVTDVLQGERLRHRRGQETRADAVTVTGRFVETPRIDTTDFKGVGDTRLPRGATPLLEGDIVDAARETADRYGIPQPLMYVSGEEGVHAAAMPGSGAAPAIVVTRGLLDANLSWDEVTAVLTHELAHATDAERGRSLLESSEQLVKRLYHQAENKADNLIERMRNPRRELEDMPEGRPEPIRDEYGEYPETDKLPDWQNPPEFPDTSPEMMGSRDLTPGVPRRGPWVERAANGPQIPEGIRAGQAKNIERAYNEAMRLLDKSQGKTHTNDQMRFRRMAEEAWAKYEGLRGAPTPEPGGARPRVEAPVQPDAGTPGVREPVSPGRPEPTDSSGVVGRTADQATPAEVGESSPIAFEPAPLPDYTEFVGPRRVVTHEDAARLVRQLRDEVAADPTLSEQFKTWSAELLTQDKISGRNLEQIMDFVAKKRAVVRGKTPEQARIDWSEDFLAKHEWIAPTRKGVGEAAPVLDRGGSEGRAAVERAALADTGDLAQDATRAVEPTAPKTDVPGREGGTTPGVQNLQGGAAGLAGGAASEDEDDDTETSLEKLGAGVALGVIGRRQPLFKNPATAPFRNSARKQAFVTPKGPIKPDIGPFEALGRWAKTRWTDDLAVLKEYENNLSKEWMKQMGTMLPSSVMAAQLKRLDAGFPAKIMVQNYLRPHLQQLDRLGIHEDDINTYLANTQDIAISNATGNPGRNFPGGSTVAKAIAENQDFVNQLQRDLTPEKYQQFQQSIDGIWDFGRRILEVKRDAGLISDDAFNAMRTTYPNYVPTKILDYLNNDNYVQFGKSLNVNSSTIHEITAAGTDREAVTPLAALLASAYEAHAAARKNTVFQAFIGMATSAAMLPSSTKAVGAMTNEERRLAKFGFGRGVIPLSSTSAKVPEGMVPLKGFIKGEKQAYAVDETLGDVTKFQAPVVVPFFTGLMHAFRAGVTAREPTFLIRNTFADLSSYMVRETSRSGPTPQSAGEAFAVWAQTMHEFVTSPGAWEWMLKGEYKGDMARYLAEGGGSAGQVQMNMRRPDPTHFGLIDRAATAMGYQGHSAAEADVHRLITRSAFDIRQPSDVARLLVDAATFKPVETIGERIELVPRVAAMRLAERRQRRLGQPFNQLESVGRGRTSTLDFSVGGSWSKTINQFVPFFNVGMQAMVDPWRAYKENPEYFTVTALTAVGGSMALAEAWNQATDSRRDAYNDVADYAKDRGMVLMFPHGEEVFPGSGIRYPEAPKDEKGNPRPQMIFYPWRQLSPIAQMTRRTLQEWVPQWRDKNVPESERRTVLEAILSGVGSMSPISANSPLDLFTSLTPLGVQTAIQVGNDWDSFRGARIKSAYADKRAAPISHGISNVIDTATGGMLSPTPAQSEFVLRDAPGLAGMYAKTLTGASEILYGKGETGDRTVRTPQDIPGAGGIIGGFVKSSIGGNAERARGAVVTPSSEKILKENGVRWRPSTSDPEIEDIPLNREEYTRYQREVNKVTDEVIRRVTSSSDFKSMGSVDKEAVIKRELDRERGFVRRDILGTIPRDEIERRYQERVDAGEIATPIRTRKAKRR